MDVEKIIDELIENIDSALDRPLSLEDAQYAYSQLEEHCERLSRALACEIAERGEK